MARPVFRSHLSLNCPFMIDSVLPFTFFQLSPVPNRVMLPSHRPYMTFPSPSPFVPASPAPHPSMPLSLLSFYCSSQNLLGHLPDHKTSPAPPRGA